MLSLGLTLSKGGLSGRSGAVHRALAIGDFEDILTRTIAKNMQEKTGVAASVVNRPGGGDGLPRSRS